VATADRTLCPSTTPRVAGEATHIVGVIGVDGRVANLLTPIPATVAVLAAAGPDPETKFRFSSPCAEGACTQWRNSECSLIGRIRAAVTLDEQAKLPVCAIRAHCRWWQQDNRAACDVCSYVSYNASGT
jgi:hypothetical protein